MTYSPAPSPAGTATSFQMLLEDTDIAYDEVGNPIELRDWRDPAEWPAGAKPVNKKVEYDDLNRVKRIAYEFPSGDDTWVSPFDRENTEGATPVDSRRAKPYPQVQYDKRLLGQRFEYDWLGNLSKSDDDIHGFYDRSLGTVTRSDSVRPYRITAATNESLGGSRTGNSNVTYDNTGNMVGLGVVRRGTCLGAVSGGCTQQYAYDWDEVGRLVRARRWDSTATSINLSVIPTTTPAAELRYRYDASDNRVIKRAYVTDSALQRHTLYVFDSLEIRRTTYASSAYAINESTQVPYLNANGLKLARLQYELVARTVPQVSGLATTDPGWYGTVGSTLHVMLRLQDHLGSTGSVIDKASGELVERTSYQVYGARESDYRASRWAGFREDYGFTDKEEDVEVGLAYFGKRFLNAQLGQWVSPDPLAVHEAGEADLNSYAYVSGALLKSIDPVGLADNKPKLAANTGDASPTMRGKTESPNQVGRILIHQHSDHPFTQTQEAAKNSGGKYELARNNESASKSEIREGLEDAKAGDIFVFEGHAAINGQAEVKGILGSGWFGDQVLTRAEMGGAISKDTSPAAVILGACMSSQLTDVAVRAGAGVAYGIDQTVPDILTYSVSDKIASSLASGMTIQEAADQGNKILDENSRLSGGAQVTFTTRADVDPSKSLVGNGLSSQQSTLGSEESADE